MIKCGECGKPFMFPFNTGKPIVEGEPYYPVDPCTCENPRIYERTHPLSGDKNDKV